MDKDVDFSNSLFSDMNSTGEIIRLSRSELILMVVIYIFLGVFAFIVDRFINKTSYEIPQIRWLLIAISTGVLISCVNIVIAYFTQAGRRLASMLKESLKGASFFFVLLLVIVGSVSEELLFRALALKWLLRHFGPWFALILTSVGFGFLHGFFRPAFLLWSVSALAWGSVLGVLMLLSGLILVPVAVHVTVNILGVVYLWFFIPPGRLDS